MTAESEHDGVGCHAQDGGIWSTRYRALTLAIITVVAVNAFDGLGVVAALPDIAVDLGNVALSPWIITGFSATLAVATVASGPIVDGVGVRRTFRIAIVWFIAATAAVSVAPNMFTLVVLRALQGLGGGMAVSVISTSVGLAYPDRLRPRAFTALSMVWGVLGLGGPVLVGALLAFSGWRVIFIAQLPIASFTAWIGWNRFPASREHPQLPRLDWWGTLWLSLFVLSTLLGAAAIGTNGVRSGASFAVAVLAAGIYWRHSGRIQNPVLGRNYLVAEPLRYLHLIVGLVLAGGLALNNYLPLYLQAGRGRSVGDAAVSLIFVTIGWTTGSVLFSRVLTRWGYVQVLAVAAAVVVVPMIMAAFLIRGDAALGWIYGAMFAIGVGIGVTSIASLSLIQQITDPSMLGRTNSAVEFVRALSVTFGIAIGGAIIFWTVERNVGDVEVVRQALEGNDVTTGAANTGAANTGEGVSEAVKSGFARVALFGVAALSMAGISALMLLRSTPPSSGDERRPGSDPPTEG